VLGLSNEHAYSTVKQTDTVGILIIQIDSFLHTTVNMNIKKNSIIISGKPYQNVKQNTIINVL